MSLLLLVPAALILLVLRGAGGAVVRRAGGDPADPGLGLATGFGIATLGVFGLALVRQVGPWALGGFLVLLSVPAIAFYRSCPGARRWPWARPTGRAERFAAALSLSILALGLIQALAPPTGMDTGTAHLLVPKMILEAGGLHPRPDMWFHRTGGFYFVHLLGYGLGGEILAKLLAFGAVLAAAALSWSLGERVRPGSGPLAALITCGSPLISSLAGHEYLEAPLLMYLLAALLAALTAPGPAGGLWVGALAGFAVGIKSGAFPALVLLPALGGLPPFAIRRRDLKDWIAMAAGFVVPAGFWAAWNLWSTGSPVYSEYAGSIGGITAQERWPLLGRAVLSTLVPSFYYWGESAGPWAPLVLLGLLCLGGPRSSRPWAWLMLAALAFYFLVVGAVMTGSLRVHSHGRYLGPFQIAFSIPLGLLLLSEAGPRARPLLLCAILVPGAVMALVKAPRALVAAPAALGIESRQAYLAKKIETFAAGERLKSIPGAKVLFLGQRGYYLEVPWIHWSHVKMERGREDLVRRIRELGATHVLYEDNVHYPDWMRDPACFERAPFREVGRWPGGVRLVEVE